MKAITRYFRVYTHFWKLAFSQGAVYRVDTLFLFISVTLYLAQNWVFFSNILKSIPNFGGLTISEYAFLLATFSLNIGSFKLFYGRTMEDVIDKIFTGQYDYTLLRPINSRFISYFCPPLVKGIFTNFLNLVFLIFIIVRLHLFTSWQNSLLYIFYLFVGQIIIFSFSQMAVATAFFTNNASDIYAIFENAWDQAAYPGEAFSHSVLFVLSYVIPIVLFASFPTRVFLGKVDNPLDFLWPIVVALVCFTVSNSFYKLGIKNYTSAGG